MPFMLVKKGKASIYVLFNDLLQVFVVIEQLFDDILRKKKRVAIQLQWIHCELQGFC